MIKLNRHPLPPSKSARSRATATKRNNKRAEQGKKLAKINRKLYGAADVKDLLRTQQFAQHRSVVEGGPAVFLRCKCAWCESWVERTTSYEEVDHYRPKSLYYWLGYAWDNLIISCKPCNTQKLDQFPLEDEALRAKDHQSDVTRERPLLINPYEDEPSEHLEWQQHILGPRSRAGEETIKVIGLNREELNAVRLEHYREFKKLRIILEDIKADDRWAERAAEADRHLQKLQASIAPGAEYSSMMLAALGRRW